MKLSEQWLREWVNPPLSTTELADMLTMAGLEVESTQPVAQSFAGVVVGEITEIKPHPDADSLRLCQVQIGDVTPLSIVCGASNVRVGMRVPTAMIGAELPGGKTIKDTTIRGVKSDGMLCSASELGLAESSEGLLELPADTRLGEDVYLYLKLDDSALELGITPNRGDCLSIAGVAREVAALSRCSLQEPVIKPVKATLDEQREINLEAPEDCPRYAGRVIRRIKPHVPSPLWLQERLRRSGVRSISPIVDVTNYVMLELGQPMHAFDLAKLDGGVCVRRARTGETLTLLDGQQVTLDGQTLVIADQRRVLAMAGIMGGLDSAIGDQTQDLFLESAWFAPHTISSRARAMGLHTESSHRFERGVDPQLQTRAVERATQLLLEIVGGEPGPVLEVCRENHLPKLGHIHLRAERIRRVLGLTPGPDEVADILNRLTMTVTALPDGWQVTPPSYRFDIVIEADLIEEVARLYGYNRLPFSMPQARLALVPQPEAGVTPNRMRQLLVDRGYQEVVTYSFVDPTLQQLVDPDQSPIALANPLSSEMSVMRTSLWTGLIQTLLYNQNRQQRRLRIFELGLNFLTKDVNIKQDIFIGGLVAGEPYPEQWGLPTRPSDFYDIKADVEALLRLGGADDDFRFIPAKHPALHPGQAAHILIKRKRGEESVGWVGALHPGLIHKLNLDGKVYVFELALELIKQRNVPKFSELSKYPAIRRDLAIVVDEAVSAEQVCACVKNAVPDYAQQVQLFDVYRGKGIDSGRKSLALGLTLQAPSRTLTDQEVDEIMKNILASLNNKLGGTLRS
ncbi:MAG TPA: phenylalanine--tRNA ligase subunit beta [Gammaproteobacteria bacterium]|nr:phenylalanine--tRNA ligase subunit beta [Gammaproteobacteria bacterium]